LSKRDRARRILLEHDTASDDPGGPEIFSTWSPDEQVEVLVVQAAFRALGAPTSRSTAYNVWMEMRRAGDLDILASESSALDLMIARIHALCAP
jgi:hypothetical protein